MNNYINWTRKYKVRSAFGPISIYVSSHKDGSYHALVFYAERLEGWDVDMVFQDQQFHGHDEEQVLQQAKDFLTIHLTRPYTIDPPEEIVNGLGL